MKEQKPQAMTFPYENLVESEIIPEFKKYYFCGYRLDKALECEIFRYIGRIALNHGICYETAAMIMLCLQNIPNARIAHGTVGVDLPEGTIRHAWTEVVLNGLKIVIDPCADLLMGKCGKRYAYCFEKDLYYKMMKAQPTKFITHDDFWQLELSSYLAHCLTNKENSTLKSGLLCAYRPINCDPILFQTIIKRLPRDPKLQEIFVQDAIDEELWSPTFPDVAKCIVYAHESYIEAMSTAKLTNLFS